MRLAAQLLLAIFLTTLFFISCSEEESFDGSFYYSPQNIKAGEKITIKYNPDSSNLAGKEDIALIAYLYSNKLDNTIDVPLTSDGRIYSGTLKTEENTLGVLFKFKSGKELDNNNNDGYAIFLSDSEGNRIAGSYAGYGAAYNRWGAYYIDMDRDKEKAYKLIIKDFTEYPEIKPIFLNTYFEIVSSIKPEKKEGIIKKELDVYIHNLTIQVAPVINYCVLGLRHTVNVEKATAKGNFKLIIKEEEQEIKNEKMLRNALLHLLGEIGDLDTTCGIMLHRKWAPQEFKVDELKKLKSETDRALVNVRSMLEKDKLEMKLSQKIEHEAFIAHGKYD